MPGELYLEGRTSVYIGNVEGDVYIGRDKARTSGDAELDASTDALVTWINSNNFESRVAMVSGIMENFLVGAQLGAMAMESVMHDRAYDTEAGKLYLSLGDLRTLPKIPAPPRAVSRMVVRFVADGIPENVSNARFRSLYGARFFPLTLGDAVGEAEITATALSSELPKIIEVLAEASQNPSFGAEAVATVTPVTDPAVQAEIFRATSEMLAQAEERQLILATYAPGAEGLPAPNLGSPTSPGGGGGGGGPSYPHGEPLCDAGAQKFSSRIITDGAKNPDLGLTQKDPTGRNEYAGVRRGDGNYQTKAEYWREVVTEAGLTPGPLPGSVDCSKGCPDNLSELIIASLMANADRTNIYIGEKSKMAGGGYCGPDQVRKTFP